MALAVALAASPTALLAQPAAEASPRPNDLVVVTAFRQGALPASIPATLESITAEEIATRINATDSEDAIRYFPSLLVRKRYIGDYNHAVLSSRASGTGNSARSLVYADGVLLSNLLGNGATFTPRWGLVTPEEVERVDVLYGPFSAAFPGNSVGAVVDYVTRLPQKFEAHARLGAFVQPFDLYNTHATYTGWQTSASLGNRAGSLAWWVNVNHLDSQGQPLTFPNRLASASSGSNGTPVDGAVAGLDKSNLAWWLLGAATQYHTQQDHAKARLAWDLGGQMQLRALLGWWQNRAVNSSESWLTRSSDGSPVTSGVVNIGGRNYSLSPGDFTQSREGLTHLVHALSLHRKTGAALDWEVSFSGYNYHRDLARTPTLAKPAADAGGAGRLTSLAGTGWTTLAAKGLWRPHPQHQVDFGLQREAYRWRQRIDSTADWLGGAATTPVSSFRGDTRLTSAYAQDTWSPQPAWKVVAGLRLEHWQAFDGAKTTGSAAPVAFAERSEHWASPKAALSWQLRPDWGLKLATGRAVRAPTVGELFQGNAGTDLVTNPNLKPEKGWTTELSSLWSIGEHRLRATLFHEATRDALYSQAIAGSTPLVSSVQNIDRLRTSGLEAALDASDLALGPLRRLDLQASLTYADSRIVANSSYVAVPGDTLGKQQPRVPHWRASLLATWHASDALSASFGARYGSRQYGTLNNSDPNGFAYMGFSSYLSTDARVHWRINRQWALALGIDNLNNAKYWNFHPYPQRTTSAELKFDL
jgi:iron complex outermembrane receptor protein